MAGSWTAVRAELKPAPGYEVTPFAADLPVSGVGLKANPAAPLALKTASGTATGSMGSALGLAAAIERVAQAASPQAKSNGA